MSDYIGHHTAVIGHSGIDGYLQVAVQVYGTDDSSNDYE